MCLKRRSQTFAPRVLLASATQAAVPPSPLTAADCNADVCFVSDDNSLCTTLWEISSMSLSF
ncbi:hypothetical protein NQZ68_012087 [Dissostichus eleginoides]|nr:hypothetical protein NQZ68_012087 [Dissostichus eleginoides]